MKPTHARVVVLVAAIAATGRARAAPMLEAEVVHVTGTPLEGVSVFALGKDGRIEALGRSNHEGRVALAVKGRRSLLGAIRGPSSSAGSRRRTIGCVLYMEAVPPPLNPARPAAAGSLVQVAPARLADGMTDLLGIARAAIVDEAGGALAGVRVGAYSPDGHTLTATGQTDGAGHVLLVLPPGAYQLRPFAPGLKPVRLDRDRGRPTIRHGHRRPGRDARDRRGPEPAQLPPGRLDDPEYMPPPQVKAWLKTQYCLDVDQMFRRASRTRDLGPAPRASRNQRLALAATPTCRGPRARCRSAGPRAS